MNERQAIESGLHFTGVYSKDREEVKVRMSELRSKRPGAKICLVNVPHSKLSRSGPGMGYAIYGDSVFSDYEVIETNCNYENEFNDAFAYYKSECDKKVEEARKRCEEKRGLVLAAKERLEQLGLKK